MIFVEAHPSLPPVESPAPELSLNEPTSPPSEGLSALGRTIALKPISPTYSSVVLTGSARWGEGLALAACGIGAMWTLSELSVASFWAGCALTAGLSVVAIVAFEAAHLYSVPIFRTARKQAVRLFASWTIVVLAFWALLNIIGFATPGERWLAIWWLLGIAVLGTSRCGLRTLVTHWTATGQLMRRTVVVGGGAAGEQLIAAINADPATDVRICGVFDDRTDERSPATIGGVLHLGTVDHLVEFARLSRVDLAIFTLPISAETRIIEMLKKLSVLPIDVRLSAHTNRLHFRPRSYSYVGNVPVIDIVDKPIADWDVVVKTLFDRVVGGALLIAAAPIMAAVAVAIARDSPGPILFRQKRYGFNNELIEVFKFRSMYSEQSDPTAQKLVTVGDPRVTRVGRFIRKTSIDELPQLLNVAVKGNLSLVGPRPHAVHAKAANRLYDQAVDGYFARHRVKPGITGWAQVSGWRGETDTLEKIEQRVKCDLYYIENWSVLLDIKILLKTPLSLLKTTNAY
jgi:Undecaprenyl-phosphate glucose phosphotransferase